MDLLPLPNIRRVAIVGSGPGGVVAAKYLRAEDHFDKIDVFEQQDTFGGIWNYSSADVEAAISVPQTSPNAPLDRPVWRHEITPGGMTNNRLTFTNPMYEQLETNIPHNLMRHSDAPSLQDHQLFPSRENVVEYLTEYAEDVRSLVQFNTQVIDIHLKLQTEQDIWVVETRKLASKKISRQEYDAVVVANGHYIVPHLPDIKGIREWNIANPGAIGHSKLYRSPLGYTNKKVLVVGNSASGADIAAQIGIVAKHPVLNSSRSDSVLSFDATWKKNVAEIDEFLSPSSNSRAIRFKDGSIETDVDAVLFCTGYYYSLPFLSSLRPKLIESGERVQHLYRHLFYIEHPSLAFIGLPSKVIPFRTFESQAAVVARVWANRLALPPKARMHQWEEQEIAERGPGKLFHVLPFPKDFQYHNALVDWASTALESEHGKMPSKWTDKETWQRERFPLIKQAFGKRGAERHGVTSIEELGFEYEQACKG